MRSLLIDSLISLDSYGSCTAPDIRRTSLGDDRLGMLMRAFLAVHLLLCMEHAQQCEGVILSRGEVAFHPTNMKHPGFFSDQPTPF